MHSEESTNESRILVSNDIYNKTNHEISLVKRTRNKKTKRIKSECKKGKLCGAKHIAICAETRENFRKGLILSYKRRDPFYMVDGVTTEEQEIESLNTNSGVLCEDDLKYLQ